MIQVSQVWCVFSRWEFLFLSRRNKRNKGNFCVTYWASVPFFYFLYFCGTIKKPLRELKRISVISLISAWPDPCNLLQPHATSNRLHSLCGKGFEQPCNLFAEIPMCARAIKSLFLFPRCGLLTGIMGTGCLILTRIMNLSPWFFATPSPSDAKKVPSFAWISENCRNFAAETNCIEQWNY